MKNEGTFWNLFFDLKSKILLENFDFSFLKLALNQNRVKKNFVFRFSFFIALIKCEKWKIFFESVYRKCNLVLDLKTKQISKVFHFSFFNFKTKIEKWKIFSNLFFDFKSKNEFGNFLFLFLKSVLNQNRFKIFFFSFLIFQFNNQIWKMKDIFWNTFFHLKSKN